MQKDGTETQTKRKKWLFSQKKKNDGILKGGGGEGVTSYQAYLYGAHFSFDALQRSFGENDSLDFSRL